MLLLDTCALLWLVDDQTQLSTRALELIRGNAEELCVSAISAFEISLKHRKGRLTLPLEPERWFGLALEHHGLFECPVSWQVATRSALLPDLHADPCDRILVATAQIHGGTLLTPDPHIANYPDVRVEW